MVERFGVGHEAQHAPRWGPSGRRWPGWNRWVERVFHGRLAGLGIGILQGDEVFIGQALQGGVVTGDELAFAVAHGHGHHGQILGEDAGALGVGQQVHPAVFVTGGVVVAQRDLALETVVVQGGQTPA